MENLDVMVLRQLRDWRQAGRRAMLVTVVRTWGSSPRPVGSIMALAEDGAVVGSVSGGCIEDDLIARHSRLGRAEMPHGAPVRVKYGVTADEAHRFGLPCGGTLELLLEFDPDATLLAELVAALEAGRLMQRRVHLVDGATRITPADTPAALAIDGATLVNTFGPEYRMLLIGTGQLAEYVATMARFCGFAVTVCDPREEYRGHWQVPGVVIREARERLEQRQREADLQRGRSDDDDRRPRGPDGAPRGGRYKREFGVPEDKAQENFTDPDSRIMKRAGGRFDPCYNAQTAVDEAAHIIVAAELDNSAPDVHWLLPMIEAVQDNLGQLPEQGLADAGYRSEDNLKNAPIDLVVALGREGKQHAQVDCEQYPHTAAMALKLKSDEGRTAYRKRKWIAEPPNGWIKHVLGFRQFSMRGLHRAQAEWKLVCAALNLRRMCALSGA